MPECDVQKLDDLRTILSPQYSTIGKNETVHK